MDLQQFLSIVWRGLLILLSLNFTYFICFKLIQWKSGIIIAVFRRIRIFAYVIINISTLWWFANYFQATSLSPYTIKTLEILFFIFAGALLIEAFNGALFDYFLPKINKAETLHIYRQLFVGGLYILLVVLILGWILRINITHLLTTSAIISVVLGLALQDTLGNLFSGLALHISRPYEVGDWVKIGNHEGKIIRIDWRSLSIRTLVDTIVVFPHSSIAKMEIMNYSNPSPIIAMTHPIGVHYRHSPHSVQAALMQVMNSVPGVLKEPSAFVRLKEYGDFAIHYLMVFYINDFSQNGKIASDIKEKVWYKFKREEIEIPYPIQNTYMKHAEKEISLSEKVEILGTIDFISSLEAKELEYLAERLKISIYSNGEAICRQGDAGESFYIVKKGSVMVSAMNENGETYLQKEMKGGSFFGEISLLTGDRRSATVTALGDVELLTMVKEDLRYIIKCNPHAEETISSSLARRQQNSIMEKAKLDTCKLEECDEIVQKEMTSVAEEFLKKIRYFFSY
jgi:small-conductance mechanosensitive channel/CRP-like cAMP-binding protein